MKRIAVALFAVVMGLGAMVPDAEAKRLGGGKSSGVSRHSWVMKREVVPVKPTTPEMAAEIQMQFRERNRLAQETDVMHLSAELLDVTTETNRAMASVRFSSQLREEVDAAPETFSEVWHLTTPLDSSRGWAIAGIQQS